MVTAADSASVNVGVDFDIYSIDIGEGPAVMFVHGGYVNMSYWDAQLDAFAGDYRVLALDLPGHGLSESPPDEELSYELFARAVEAVREEAGVDQIVLVGHSMGGPVIRQYVSMFPEHVAALVAVDVSLDVRGVAEMTLPPPSAIRPTIEALEMAQQAQFALADAPAAVRVRVLELMAPGILSGSPDLLGMNRRSIEEMVAGGDALRVANEVIEVPALHVFAESSEGGWDPDFIREVIPYARFETIAETGHFLMMEKPEEFNGILRDFLESLDL
jgi:pimeloyl-ACP methyl ester carboxylesterase